jgi:hypothetical protein
LFCPEDLKLVTMKGVNVRRKFLLNVSQNARLKVELRKAVTFAREQLLQEIRRNGYNILLFERSVFLLLHPCPFSNPFVKLAGYLAT